MHENLNQLISYIISQGVGGLFIWLVIWGSKLPRRLKDNTDAIIHLTEKVEDIRSEVKATSLKVNEAEKRHEITQMILSDIIDEKLDTAKILEDNRLYPTFKNYHSKFRR